MPLRTFALPTDANNSPLSVVPSKTAVAGTTIASLSSAATYALGTATELVEVSAITNGVYLKWGTTAVTSNNMDAFVGAGQTRHYAVPTQTVGTPGVRFGQFTIKEYAASGTAVIIEY